MEHTYSDRKRGAQAAPGRAETVQKQPGLAELRAGIAEPSSQQMGHRVDMPDAIRAKMEESFGTDLSAVKLYESEAVSDAGAKAITKGTNIAFAPGMLDFTSYSGQAILGHELSHVMTQARGEVTGSGFLNDHALEARADREGAMAASGRQVSAYSAPLSAATAASAAGPMQAIKEKDKIQVEPPKPEYGMDTAIEEAERYGEPTDTDDVHTNEEYASLPGAGALQEFLSERDGKGEAEREPELRKVSKEEQQAAIIQQQQTTIREQHQEIVRLRNLLAEAGIDPD